MIGSAASWRRMLKFWLPALVLVVVNLAILSTYRFLLAGQAQMRSAKVERLSRELEDLEQRSAALSELMARAEANRIRVEEFHGQWLSTEAGRLTRVIAEVKTLARRAGVETSSFRYPGEALDDFGLIRRSIVFATEGSYGELRQFIELIERSDQFLVLEEVRLNESGDPESEVRVHLRVSTLFVDRSEEAAGPSPEIEGAEA